MFDEIKSQFINGLSEQTWMDYSTREQARLKVGDMWGRERERERGREGERERGREGGRERGREGERERGREGGREGGKD